LILSGICFIFQAMNWIILEIKGTEVSIAFDENSIHVYNAFPIKDDLKMRGYRWNPGDKSWFSSPGDVEAELGVLKNNLEKGGQKTIPGVVAGPLTDFPPSCSVVELRQRIELLLQEGLQGRLWVRGVVASEVKNYRWFSYFDLEDEDENRDIYFNMEVKNADLEAINRRLKESRLAEALDKDLPLFCLVEVHLSVRHAVDIRLRLLEILPAYTQAKIRNQLDITLEKLKKEGVLENQKHLVLPVPVFSLGLITSGQGTSVQDILAALGPMAGKYRIYFVDTRMEGAHAVDSLVAAIDYLENRAGLKLDALLITRGGGSEQSLAVFNDYRICRRVCDCRIPVLTAIGHEKDVSAVEICSHLTPAPSTPTGLGKYLQERFINLRLALADQIQALIHYFTQVRQREIEKLRAFARAIPAQALMMVRMKENRFLSLARRLAQGAAFMAKDRERRKQTLRMQVSNLSIQGNRMLGEKERIIQRLLELAGAHDPEKILKKGFALVLADDDRVIKSLGEFDRLKKARLKFHDGLVKIKKEEEL